MTRFLWAVYPYLCFVLFFGVAIYRMLDRPFVYTTRASGIFGSRLLGISMLFFHWGILVVLVSHMVGWIGGMLGWPGWIQFFFWGGLIGGACALLGSIVALIRRFVNPEVRAMSQSDDYAVHFFLIPILGIGLYQVVIDKIFGLAYTAAPWFASIWTLAPQPELMASASFLTKLHIFLALTFFAYFPFTKLVHFWSLPINYFVRPYQSMRSVRYVLQRKLEFRLRTDQSYLLYAMGFVVVASVGISLLTLVPGPEGMERTEIVSASGLEQQTGYPLYVSQCARCHGTDGSGVGPGSESPLFDSRPRDLLAAQYRFVSTDNGVASGDDLYRTLLHGLEPAGMPGFSELSNDQLTSLVAVLETFRGDVAEDGEAIEIAARPPLSNASLQVGAELFADVCAMCHGASGGGDGELANDFHDVDGRLVRPADLSAGRTKAGLDSDQVYLRIVAGIPGGDVGWLMPPLNYLEPDEIWAVVDYLETNIFPKAAMASATAAR